MQEYYQGIPRTISHMREFSAKDLLHMMGRLEVLHQLAEKRGWDEADTMSRAVLSGRAARMDKRPLPPQEPMSEAEFLAAGVAAAKIAKNILNTGGWGRLKMSPWIDCIQKAKSKSDLISLIDHYSQLGCRGDELA